MPYHTASLPDPIRQQVEDFIEFLLWKHGQVLPPQHEAPDATRRQAIGAIVAAYQALPVQDARSPEDLLYDANGLPKPRQDHDCG